MKRRVAWRRPGSPVGNTRSAWACRPCWHVAAFGTFSCVGPRGRGHCGGPREQAPDCSGNLTRCPRSSHGDVGATEEDQGSPRAGPPGRGRDGRGRDGRPRRAAGEPRARRASRAAGTEAGRGPVRSGCPRRSAPAALRAGDFRAGRGAQGAPGAGLGERARVPGVPLPCPARAFPEPRVGHPLARGSPGSRGEGSLFLLQGTRRPERATSERTSRGAARA